MLKKIGILFFISILVFSTASCSFIKTKKPLNDEKKSVQKPNVNVKTSSSDVSKDAKDKSAESEAKDTTANKGTVNNTVNNDVYNPQINTDGLDNTLYGWGMRVLPDHKTPEITSKAMSLIKKYDGIFTGDTTKKYVYLTFDEGYENGYTPKILDILKANNVKAAFFVTGPYIKEHGDLVKRMVAEGHIVGNHTVNHPSLPKISDEKVKSEITGLAEMFKELTGKDMHYLRPPMGEYSERTLYITKSLGYKTVFWSLALADWQPLPGGPDESYNTVMNRIHPGAVILLHAVSKDDTMALDRILKDIKAQGYVFKTLDDLSK
ncbi:delta-lactam-biosynthetic de-N-acetylase [Thermoanaerobacterium thermosaccharolyticum DSM 571]|uniref:Delta-lactam-biosynthetic de-N-acetylase n=1 Tax=Thermoanaerobacterium thermosaccharolyticum (strain ATCC 7956 / DSM 571 / NCIMB 9385 / NCA 3814 / NCTC 13789 / WDCM 00135 / 2032) TaxID=580327 RepID=D9TSX2_THETC|nr:delta-lactam-biosynthetic de-N-acetylase [Thermoanaerobacterium thermosaccharolyticum]ADL68137.1 delta-lactam-biosynthetic de-N-acetylase [Thermoanaerobacterium thermosaccharolyticum DSM 571]